MKINGYPYYRLKDSFRYPSKKVKDFVQRRVGGLAEHSQCHRPLIDLLANAYSLGIKDALDCLKHMGEIKMTDQEFKEYHDKAFAEMPNDLKIKAIKFLKTNIPDDQKIIIKNLYNEDPIYWITKNMIHFGWGMQVRNELRTKCGILDNQLPTGNWDDYYTQCVEAACDLRPYQTLP